jgi:hypothetical protein
MRAAISSAILVVALLLTPAPAAATVIYVDPDSPTDAPATTGLTPSTSSRTP